MVVERATLEDAIPNGIDLSSNAFMLIHGWTAGHILIEFVARALKPLKAKGMTPADLAAEIKVNVGPLKIMLRTCSILGYLKFEAEAGTYAAEPGPELDALEACLGPDVPAAAALKSIYTDAIPPFQVPSDAAAKCLEVWTQHRAAWRASKSQALQILLDGVVLAPLLTSVAYFARWDEAGLDFGKDQHLEELNFSKVDAAQREVLGAIFSEIGVGSMNAEGMVKMTSKGALAFQRCYSFFVPTSYSPMLSKLTQILTEDAGWGFVDTEDGEPEEHVMRTLNVVGSGAQHKTFFKDMMRHVHALFNSENFEAQPRFVVDVGSGDGHLLMHIYEHVKNHTKRGKVLEEHPLTMVGVDFNEEARVATALNLSNHNIPHRVIAGDIGKPSAIMTALKRKKVDLAKTLHVRSFLDHDRPYIAPKKVPEDGSVKAVYAKTQMSDVTHLDKEGNAISETEVFASLVEHFERWSDAIDGSFGLCVLEVMMLDGPTTKRFLNDNVSFHFDIVQCMSRQYMISPPAFTLAAAMAGLFPADFDTVQTYPEQGKYCRVLNQRLVRRPYKIRFAEPSDMDDLMRLEELTWAENLRAKPEVLKKRLETSPTTNLVVELDGKVVAVLYMQLVDGLDVVNSEKFMEISDKHSPAGNILQLIAIGSDPEVANMGIGSALRSFALHLARVDPKIESVIGVTRCKSFADASGTMEDYVQAHKDGKVNDKTLGFHTSYGAKVLRCVPGFRPEDTDNGGTGVLIQYLVKEWTAKELKLTGDGAKEEKAAPTSDAPTVEILTSIMADLSYEVKPDDLARGFLDYGADSLELVRIRNKLGAILSLDLQPTMLLDYPNVADLSAEVDKLREAKKAKDASKEPEKLSWDNISAPELVQVLEKCNKKYALPQYQSKFSDLAGKNEDKDKYLSAIESILVEVEGPILVAHELIEDAKTSTVQGSRLGMAKCIQRLAAGNPAVKTASDELLRLTGQSKNGASVAQN